MGNRHFGGGNCLAQGAHCSSSTSGRANDSAVMTSDTWMLPINFLASGLGAGLVPVIPGTVGTLMGVIFFWLLAHQRPLVYAGIVATFAVAGVFICGQAAAHFGAADPGFIVWDEITGFLMAMFLLPRRWRWIAAGFVLFRVFDVWKPFPIRAVDQGLGGGLGIMADDLIAAFYTMVVLHFVLWMVRRRTEGRSR